MNKIDIKFIMSHVHGKRSIEDLHSHACNEFVYYVRGKGKSTIGKKTYDYAPNTFAFIPANVSHSEYHETETKVVFFAYDINSDLLNVNRGVFKDNDGEILRYVEEIHGESLRKETLYKLAMENIVEKILILVNRKLNMPADKDKLENYMDFVVNYINMNVQSDINVRSVAASIGYSYDYFRHQFRERFGMSVKEYIVKTRVENVKEYLVNSEEPIEKIAKRFFFTSQSHLTVVFRKYTGYTPAQYRKEYIVRNDVDSYYKKSRGGERLTYKTRL